MADPNRLQSRGPGEDDGDPYADVDIGALPYWWRAAIVAYEKNDFRPYRPPRLEDGALKYRVVESLEAEFEVTIRLLAIDPEYGDDWTLLVDDVEVGRIGRHRSPRGYSVFEISSDEFADVIAHHLRSDPERGSIR